MAELTISPDEIRDALKDFVKAYEPGKSATTEVGYVTDADLGRRGLARLVSLDEVLQRRADLVGADSQFCHGVSLFLGS